MQRVVVVGWVALALFGLTARAYAAELRWDAPADCAHRGRALAQIERLIGRPLADVAGLDFEVELGRRIADDWRVVVRALPRGPAEGDAGASGPRVREIAGGSCDEVTDAAAVAVAMAALERDAGSSDEAPEPAPAAAPAPDPATAPELANDVADGGSDEAGEWRFGVVAGAAFDIGALPDPALGAQLELLAGYGALRLIALGTVFASQQTRLADGERGGEFELMLAALLVCAEPGDAAVRGLGCLGFEIGELRGFGIASDPREGAAGVRALRAEAGVLWGIGAGFSLIGRAGLGVALTRPPFVIDGADRVHRPARLGLRGLLGLELVL